MSKKKMKKSAFFEDLKAGLEDVLAHTQGKLHLRSEFIEIPEPPAEYKPKEIRNIREKCRYSQGLFARVLNVSTKTVQSWESGDRTPNHAALRLLEIIDQGIYRPEVFQESKK